MAVDSYHFMKLSKNIRLGYAQNMMRHETNVPNKRLIKIAEVVNAKTSNENVVKDYLDEIQDAKIQAKKAELEKIESIKKQKRNLKRIIAREKREKEKEEAFIEELTDMVEHRIVFGERIPVNRTLVELYREQVRARTELKRAGYIISREELK